jgi:hypothetical protein
LAAFCYKKIIEYKRYRVDEKKNYRALELQKQIDAITRSVLYVVGEEEEA